MKHLDKIEYYLDKLIALDPDLAERRMEARIGRLRLERRLREQQIADNFDVSAELARARAKVVASNAPSLEQLTEKLGMCQWGPHGCSYPACNCYQLKPCRSPYCECEQGKCTHPGFFDARHLP